MIGNDAKLAGTETSAIWRTGIFPITKSIFQGPYVSRARADGLRSAQVAHVLNVSDVPNELVADASLGVASVNWISVEDLVTIKAETAIECLQHIHRIVSVPDNRIFVHCVAGRNRSATIVWLYLVAAGIEPEVARVEIGKRSPDAVPAHPKLIDSRLIHAIKSFGERTFQPSINRDALSWWDSEA